jgi:acyl-CoA reductase-like NAD-dependent aldehyde dehydrogenase
LVHEENGKTMDEAIAEIEKCIELTEFACSLPQWSPENYWKLVEEWNAEQNTCHLVSLLNRSF